MQSAFFFNPYLSISVSQEIKVQLSKPEVEYLRHVVPPEGVSIDPSIKQAMEEWPIPQSIKALRGFLGPSGYYESPPSHFGYLFMTNRC